MAPRAFLQVHGCRGAPQLSGTVCRGVYSHVCVSFPFVLEKCAPLWAGRHTEVWLTAACARESRGCAESLAALASPKVHYTSGALEEGCAGY